MVRFIETTKRWEVRDPDGRRIGSLHETPQAAAGWLSEHLSEHPDTVLAEVLIVSQTEE